MLNSKVKAAILIGAGSVGTGAVSLPLAYGVGRDVGQAEMMVRYEEEVLDSNIQLLKGGISQLEKREQSGDFSERQREIAQAFRARLALYEEMKATWVSDWSGPMLWAMSGQASDAPNLSMATHRALIDQVLQGEDYVSSCRLPASPEVTGEAE